MLRVGPSKEIRISLYAAAALTLILGYADLWRGGTTISAFLLAIGYCAMIPLVIWSGVLGEKDPREIDKPEYVPAAIAAFVVLVLYLITMAPSTAMWDTSEYIAAAYTFGLPHPPGNPFFVIIGRVFSLLPVAGSVAARINVLAQGLSGVRPEAAEVLVAMLANNVHPRVPSQGSVGAAGDLAPLAHIAWVACGYDGERHGFEPLRPTPKEALALINGCSVTAALAALAVARAERLFDTAVAVTAMTMEVVRADAGAIDERPASASAPPVPSIAAGR